MKSIARIQNLANQKDGGLVIHGFGRGHLQLGPGGALG